MGDFLFFVLHSVVVIALAWTAYRSGMRRVRKEAVEAGVAEWVVTGSNGQTEFRWKEVGSDERK